MTLEDREPGDEDFLLLARSARGDVAAFEKFMTAHQAAVARFLGVRARTSTDAEDLLQETFLQAWRKCAQFRGTGSARSWLFTIGRRLCDRKYGTARTEEVDVAALEELGARAGWGVPGLARTVADKLDDRLALSEAMARLPEVDRQVLLLRDVEGMSNEESAAVLSLGVPAVKSRIHRARLRLAAALRGETVS